LGWKGAIKGHQWRAPALPDFDLSFLDTITNPDLLREMLLPSWVRAFFIIWREAEARARREGPRLADAIRKLAAEHREVRVLAFSLGTRVLHTALQDLNRRRPRVPLHVRLCGGAFPQKTRWQVPQSLLAGPIVNYWSKGDLPLRLLALRYGLLQQPIGLGKLQRCSAKYENRHAHIDNVGVGHVDYERTFAQFGEL